MTIKARAATMPTTTPMMVPVPLFLFFELGEDEGSEPDDATAGSVFSGVDEVVDVVGSNVGVEPTLQVVGVARTVSRTLNPIQFAPSPAEEPGRRSNQHCVTLRKTMVMRAEPLYGVGRWRSSKKEISWV